jgi:hypothetical protein
MILPSSILGYATEIYYSFSSRSTYFRLEKLNVKFSKKYIGNIKTLIFKMKKSLIRRKAQQKIFN